MNDDIRTISIFGSTGSVGSKAFDFIALDLSKYKVKALIAGSNITLLAKQIMKCNPEFAVIVNGNVNVLRGMICGVNTVILDKNDIHIATSIFVDVCIFALPSIYGLNIIGDVLRSCRILGLANKESMVCAGNIINRIALENNVTVLPVDSEHHALLRILQEISGGKTNEVSEFFLMGSGGPFLNFPSDAMKSIKPSQAMNHPVWKMGNKISIDSATMVNKCFELIVACNILKVDHRMIKIVIHPESIVHGMISYVDGTLIAMASEPDMQIVVSNAITYPKIPIIGSSFDFRTLNNLTFDYPDENKFPILKTVRSVIEEKGNASLIFNVANDLAVNGFMNGRILFTDICIIIEEMLSKLHNKNELESFEDVLLSIKNIATETSKLFELENCY